MGNGFISNWCGKKSFARLGSLFTQSMTKRALGLYFRSVSTLIRRIPGFIIALLAFTAAALTLLLLFDPGHPTLWANARHSARLDTFFHQMTLLGDWVIYLLAVAVGWRISHRRALATIMALALSGLLVSLLKFQVFDERKRPAGIYANGTLRQVECEEHHHAHSFPSGHTTTAFAGFCCLAFFTRSRALQFLFGLAAIAVAYSRLYLGQHFLGDTLAGAMLGTLCALGSEYLFFHWKPRWLDNENNSDLP
jgi:membrane-associated phospholipid phosphatase